MTHVDRFIDSPSRREDGQLYARWVLSLYRLPAILLTDFEPWISQNQLYCTYEGERYKVTGASRLGDIWITKDFHPDHRVRSSSRR